MNYIYDIFLNLNENLYDFFDWNKNDKIMHIKKVPIFIVSNQTIKDFISNNIIVSEDLLCEIYNTTEIWNLSEKLDYCALFSDNTTIVAIQFNKLGKSIKKSFLLVDEELEVLESITRFKTKKIKYEISQKINQLLKTRKELSEDSFVKNELKSIDNNKLKYIYFECFGKQEKDSTVILKNINKLSKNSKAYKNLYDILKLTSTSKNKML